jgi:hypothetical protein
MRLETTEHYRAAIEEARELEGAPEGTREVRRRQEMIAAMHQYELEHIVDPNCRLGRPHRRNRDG